jgi:chemotaxis protein CheX
MNDVDTARGQEPKVVEAFASGAIVALQELTQFDAFVESTPAPEVFDSPDLIVATIRLVRKLPGTMTLLLTAESASRLAYRYLPKGTPLTDEIIKDVAGEIANVIAGQAKTILKGTPYHFTLSTPTVARVSYVSQADDVVDESRMASITFDAERLILLVQLPPCAGA